MFANRPHALAGALLTTAFIAGGAAGWGLRGWAITKRRSSEENPQAMVAHLTKQLGLSPGQQDSVRTVLERHRIDVASIWHTARPRMDSLRRVMQLEIEEVLTPIQLRHFRELMARHEQRRRMADSLGEEEWDADHDRIPLWLDKCQDTPAGTPVDTTGCTVSPDRHGGR